MKKEKRKKNKKAVNNKKKAAPTSATERSAQVATGKLSGVKQRNNNMDYC